MGYAIARAALAAGATVTLVSGPVSLTPPANADLIKVETAAQMYDAVMAEAPDCDIYIGTAAVADYAPVAIANEKIKKDADQIVLSLKKTKDILSAVAQLGTVPFVVGFAAETDNLEAYALNKLRSKNLDMIAANWVGQTQGGFDSEQNSLEIFWHNGHTALPMMGKDQLARQLIDMIAMRFHEKNKI